MLRNALRRFWWVIPVVLLVAVGGFVLWASSAAVPLPVALDALESDELITVDTNQWLVFRPEDENDLQSVGFIFYPGGRVDARAYAPLIRDIADDGYLSVIVPMPLNLAVFASGSAADVIDNFPEIDQWVIGGHSLGGAMAASYVYSNPGDMDGLVLWASYPAGNNDLSTADVDVASIYGTLDGLASVESVDGSRVLLPEDTQFVAVEGGNHAQFGYYGPQAGDNEATISPEDQRQQVVEATLAILEEVEGE
jgi:hypothetical protein